jgi:hypothetical protein
MPGGLQRFLRQIRFGMCQNNTGCAVALLRCALKSSALPPLADGALLAQISLVIWFYERKGEHLRCEIHEQNEGDKYALIVTLPDGTERTEMFDDSVTLRKRSIEIERSLREVGWDGPFARDY